MNNQAAKIISEAYTEDTSAVAETAGEAGIDDFEGMCAEYERLDAHIKSLTTKRDLLGQRVAEIAIPLNVGDWFTSLSRTEMSVNKDLQVWRDAKFTTYKTSDVFRAVKIYIKRTYSGIATPSVNAVRQLKTGGWSERVWTFTNEYEFRAVAKATPPPTEGEK